LKINLSWGSGNTVTLISRFEIEGSSQVSVQGALSQVKEPNLSIEMEAVWIPKEVKENLLLQPGI